MAKPTAAQLQKINKFTKEPLSEDNTYVHKFRLIGTRYIPSRFLQIDKSLLSIYKKFVDNGDVVQIADHSFGGLFKTNITLPFGRFFEGGLTEDDGETHLDGTMYMKAGQKTYLSGGFTTDDINEQLDAGILHDSSVTISWGRSECSICGNDIRDYENCWHWPGQAYLVNKREVQCFVVAKPAEKNDRSIMIENSIVCAGAYPDAGVISAAALSGVGDIGTGVARTGAEADNKKQAQIINNMTDLKLVKQDAPVFCLLSSNSAELLVKPEDVRDVAELHDLYHKMYQEQASEDESELPEGWTMTKLVRKHAEAVEELISQEQEHYMKDALDGTIPASLKKQSLIQATTSAPPKGDDSQVELIEQLCQILGCTQEELADKVKDLQAQLSTAQDAVTEKDKEIERLMSFEEKVKELEPLAEIGRQYREDLIEEALSWGVKAYANSFNADVNRKMLSAAGMSLDDIKAVKAQYEEVARQAIATGRVTQGNAGADDKDKKLGIVDDSLYFSK